MQREPKRPELGVLHYCNLSLSFLSCFQCVFELKNISRSIHRTKSKIKLSLSMFECSSSYTCQHPRLPCSFRLIIEFKFVSPLNLQFANVQCVADRHRCWQQKIFFTHRTPSDVNKVPNWFSVHSRAACSSLEISPFVPTFIISLVKRDFMPFSLFIYMARFKQNKMLNSSFVDHQQSSLVRLHALPLIAVTNRQRFLFSSQSSVESARQLINYCEDYEEELMKGLKIFNRKNLFSFNQKF